VKVLPCCPTRQSLSTGIRPWETTRKEETIRVVSGTVYFYVQGENTFNQGFLVKGQRKIYTLIVHEIILKPGDQITFQPGEKTLVPSRTRDAVMYSFSSVARDALDQFTES